MKRVAGGEESCGVPHFTQGTQDLYNQLCDVGQVTYLLCASVATNT